MYRSIAAISVIVLGLAAPSVASPADEHQALVKQYRYRASIYVSQWRGPWIPKRSLPLKGASFLVVGSSSIVGQLGMSVHHYLNSLGFDVVRRGKSASGLTRTDYFDWWKELDKLKVPKNTVGALVYMGVNDAQGIWLHPKEMKWAKRPSDPWIRWQQPGWSEIYRDRVTSFANALCNRGVGRVIFLLPVDVSQPRLNLRLSRVRKLQREGVERSSCGAAVSAAGDFALLQGFRGLRSQKRRAADGYHLSPFGAEIVWKRIRGHLLHLVGGLPAPASVHHLVNDKATLGIKTVGQSR